MSESPELYFASSTDGRMDDDETILDTIVAMRIQEEHGGYRKSNYLKVATINSTYLATSSSILADIERRKPTRRQKSFCSTLFTPNHDCEESYSNAYDDDVEANDNELDVVDSSCHQKMVQWCYQVCNCCNFRKETVEIAMSILSRYMITQAGQQAAFDRSFYQLAAMTCFYTAVKVHEPVAMDPSLVSKLSGHVHSVEEVETMESIILNEIQWKINPPTSLEFCRYMLHLLPSDVAKFKNKVYEVCEIQIEFAVSQYKAVTVNSSTLACSSILNSIAHIRRSSDIYINPTSLSQYISMIKQIVAVKNTPEYDIIQKVQQFLSTSIPKIRTVPVPAPQRINKPKKWSRSTGTPQRQYSLPNKVSSYPPSSLTYSNTDEMNKIMEYTPYPRSNENIGISASKAVNALNGYCATLQSTDKNIHTNTSATKTKSVNSTSSINSSKYRYPTQGSNSTYSYHPL